jgi:error-prone DNA polymerase
VRLGLEALAVTDHDGFYGVVRFAEAARAVGLPTVFGAELTPRRPAEPRSGRRPRPGASTWWCWPATPRATPGWPGRCQHRPAGRREGRAHGWRRRGPRRQAGGGHWAVLTGCRKGTVPPRWSRDGPGGGRPGAGPAGRGVRAPSTCTSSCGITATRSTRPATTRWPSWRPRRGWAGRHQQRALRHPGPAQAGHRAGGGAGPSQPRRARRLAARGGGAPAVGGRAGPPLRPLPGCGRAAAELGRSARSTCRWWRRSCRRTRAPTARRSPLSEMAFLRQLVEEGARRRYGDRPPPRRPVAARPVRGAQIDHELDGDRGLGFAGYFLIVWDIVEFCEPQRHLLPGPGLGGQQAVCYALGITKADAVRLGLLFERFLSPERDGPPDIDLDIESGSAARRSSSTSTSATAAPTPPRSPTSSPTGPARRCATWPRRWATRRASRTPGPRSWTGGGRLPEPAGPEGTT